MKKHNIISLSAAAEVFGGFHMTADLLQFVNYCFSFTNIVITFEFHIEISRKFQKYYYAVNMVPN